MMSGLIAATALWSPTQQDLTLMAPELAWVGTLCLILLGPLFVNRSPRFIATIALLGMAVIAYCTYRVGRIVEPAGLAVMSPAASGSMLIVDNLSIFFKYILIVFLAGVTILWWNCSVDTETDAPEFFILLLGSALGMALMVSTQHLLMIVVAIEFASLPSYAIVGANKRNRLAAEASLKYVVFGGVCAAITLYGASLLYGMFGTLDAGMIAREAVEKLAAGGKDRLIVSFGLFCTFVGIGFKISAVPFHFWCPDAFQGARTEVTTWLSVASKAAGLLLLLRLVHAFGMNLGQTWLAGPAWVIGLLAAVTCTWGNFAAYMQTSAKRMLAYSSIAHAGYMMMAAALFVHPATTPQFPAISAVLAYIVVYMLMNLGAFGVVALLGSRNGGDDSIEAFSGLIRRSPGLAIPMICCLVSLVGLPPFAGFLTKVFVLSALFEGGKALFYMLIIVAVANTLISLWYYVRIIIAMCLKDRGEPELNVPPGGLALVNVCGILLVVLLILGKPLKRNTDAYARNLFAAPVATSVAVSDASAQSTSR
jgi:NADH-quinone oxidoreductase subunit N